MNISIVPTFLYAILYKIEHDENVIIYRVLDCRQDPDKTARQLT